jgi:outer membrane protein OmpA-like peptidoglycan-associated protein
MRVARLMALTAVIAGLLNASCASRRPAQSAPDPPEAPKPTLVVLLPDPDGTTGRARVSNEFGAVDLNAERHSTIVMPDGRPAPVRVMEQSEVERIFASALAALPPAPRHFTLRFRFESDELTEESRAMMPDILASVQSFPFPEVAVVGHTDTMGNADTNVALGLKRATSVQRLLVTAGLDPKIIEIRSHGEVDQAVKTGNNTPEPRNRRVEIVVR